MKKNWQTLKQQLVTDYHPALVLERVVPFALRRSVHTILGLLTLLTGITALLLAPNLHILPLSYGGMWDIRFLGLFFLCLALWIVSSCLRAVHYYYVDAQWPLAKILYDSSPADPVQGFLKSYFGRSVLLRSGASWGEAKQFLQDRPTIIKASELSFSGLVDIASYVAELLRSDTHFAHFLFSFGLTETDVKAIVAWVLGEDMEMYDIERWWSREHLGTIQGIGKTWSYGRLFELEKYQRFLPPATSAFYGNKELAALEVLLQRGRQANAFLVGDNLEEKIAILSQLNVRIEEGKVSPELEHKQLVVLDTDILISAAESMSDFERLVRMLGNEAASVGNVILVFLDFPAFVAAGQRYGLDVATILDPFFTAAELHIVALAADQAYHILIERAPLLAQRFGAVILESTSTASTFRALQEEAAELEGRHAIFFTYQALQAIVEGGDRYIVSGLQPEKSLSLMRELVPQIPAAASRLIHREDVEDFLRAKTGIPQGHIDDGERARLLGLETILHQRIVGQDEAVNAISAAVRRARSGINNPNRPSGSFLFLGPTGVGKTETTKALADVFFGHGASNEEASIERLDMSEYSSNDALEKLIGQSTNTPGILSDMVREHPYGVLLLDEFEKTTSEVMNLFLQILDEGFFSDGAGVKVNCRNLLIIATSNAGAELIWDAIKQGKDLSHSRELILDNLIHQGVFRPELLNRFDGVIIFHPLSRAHLEKVARLQLEALAKRLATRGLNLAVTDDLIKYVMTFGTDPKFGARPMARAIQDTVEQAVADKMIAGNLAPGANIVLSAADLAKVHRI